MRHPLVAWLWRFASRLRFPWLVALTATLLVVDLLVPDFIPLVDEILLALATLILAGIRRKPIPENNDESGPGTTVDMGRAREVE